MTNSEFLKVETKKLHDETEAKMESDRIFSKDYSLEEYKKLLTKMYVPYSSIENALRKYHEPKLQSLLDNTYKEKAFHLEKDLSTLGIESLDKPTEFEIGSYEEALGALYVLKGSDMGAEIINKRLARVSEDWDVKTFEFYSSESNPRESWQVFKSELDSIEMNETEQQSLYNGARKAFLAFR